MRQFGLGHAAGKYNPPSSLRLQWALICMGIAIFFAGWLYWLGIYLYPGGFGIRPFLAACSLFCLLEYVHINMDENRRIGSLDVLPKLGVANLVTLVRGALAAGMVCFVGIPHSSSLTNWLPGFLFVLIAIGDSLDGYLARRLAQTTVLGGKLDLLVDVFAALVAILILVASGRLPRWFLLIAFTPPIFHGLRWLRSGHGRPMRALRPSTFRRIVGGSLLGFLCIALLPIIPSRGIRAMGIGVAVTIAISFVCDWLYTTKETASPWVDTGQRAGSLNSPGGHTPMSHY